MFDNKVHSIENRIVSIHQPYIRPIVRGKAKAPVGFGAKYDVSIDEKGHARLEKIQFEPYNEGQILQDVIERYKDRTGHYTARVLVDQYTGTERIEVERFFSLDKRCSGAGLIMARLAEHRRHKQNITTIRFTLLCRSGRFRIL